MDWKVTYVTYADVPILRLDLTNQHPDRAEVRRFAFDVDSTEASITSTHGHIDSLTAYKEEQDKFSEEGAKLCAKLDKDIAEKRKRIEALEKKGKYYRKQLKTVRARNQALFNYMEQRLKVIRQFGTSYGSFKPKNPYPQLLQQALRDCEWKEDAILENDKLHNPFQ
jgi:septal ring factor EnvC (AmiA/AmiB activator)